MLMGTASRDRSGDSNPRPYNTAEVSRVSFKINVEALSPTEAFPYLKSKIAYNNSNWTEVYQKLRKAQRRWGMIARVLVKTGGTVRSRG